METITLPLEVVRSLMFNFDEYWGERPISRYRNEPEPFFPTLVPRQLGLLFKERDPKENIFKVFIYPSHAEVWHINHWRNSVSAKWHVLADRNSETGYVYDKDEGALMSAIKKHLLTVMPSFADKSHQSALQSLTLALRRAPKEVTDKIPGLTDLIVNHTTAHAAKVEPVIESIADLPYICRAAFSAAVYPLTPANIYVLSRYVSLRRRMIPSTAINKHIGYAMLIANRHWNREIFTQETIIKYYESPTA